MGIKQESINRGLWPSAATKTLLRTSFLRIIPYSQEAAESAYLRLWEFAPELRRELPNTSLADQAQMLIKVLAQAVDLLQCPEKFQSECRHIVQREMFGNSNSTSRALERHFTLVGQLVIEEFERLVKPPLTAEEVADWGMLYAFISHHLLDLEVS